MSEDVVWSWNVTGPLTLKLDTTLFADIMGILIGRTTISPNRIDNKVSHSISQQSNSIDHQTSRSKKKEPRQDPAESLPFWFKGVVPLGTIV